MKYKIFFLTIITLLIFSHCTEIIDDYELNDNQNERLIVDGSITDEQKPHRITLSKTSSYFYNERTPRVSGAEVTISDGENVFPLTETTPGEYETAPDVAGEPGRTYTLNITLQDGEKYTASSYMKPLYPMDSLGYEYYKDPFGGDYFYKIYVFAQERPGIGDCYMWDYYLDSELKSDTLNEKSLVDDEMYDGKYIHHADIFWIPEYEITKEKTRLTVKMYSISEEYFDFYIALMHETDWRGGPFDGPSANVPSNISNEALGFFYASSVSYSTVDVLYQQSKYKIGE